MRTELDDKLVADFPKLYAQRNQPCSKTAMCWGFPGDGWEPLIRRLSEKLEPLGCEASQVKEKFGTLRFYLSYPPDLYGATVENIERAVRDAEEESVYTCERCGKPGELRREHGWLVTLCEECNSLHRGHAVTAVSGA